MPDTCGRRRRYLMPAALGSYSTVGVPESKSHLRLRPATVTTGTRQPIGLMFCNVPPVMYCGALSTGFRRTVHDRTPDERRNHISTRVGRHQRALPHIFMCFGARTTREYPFTTFSSLFEVRVDEHASLLTNKPYTEIQGGSILGSLYLGQFQAETKIFPFGPPAKQLEKLSKTECREAPKEELIRIRKTLSQFRMLSRYRCRSVWE
jgi:hypothetical protein